MKIRIVNMLLYMLTLIAGVLFTACAGKEAVASPLYSDICIGAEQTDVNYTRQTKTFKIGECRNLVACGVNVNVSIGSSSGQARVEATDDIMPYVRVAFNQGVLKVWIEGGFSGSIKKLPTIYITTSSLENITATSSATVKLNKGLSVPKFKVVATSSSSIRIPSLIVTGSCVLTSTSSADIEIGTLTAEVLKAVSTSSACILIKGGSVDGRVELTATSSGTLQCSDMSADYGDAIATSCGTVYCSVRDARVTYNSSGRVYNR